MKLIATGIVLLAAAALAVTSYASAGEGGRGADRLFGGGQFHFDFDLRPGELVLPRDFSVTATGNGRRVRGTRFYGHPGRATPAPAEVLTCLNVEANRAVVGRSTETPVGGGSVQYFEDNGPPGPDPADRVTPNFVMTAQEVAELMPGGFPRVCPSTTPPPEWGDVWVDLESGDIVVAEGPGGDD